jgi:hypothetical protein
MKRSLFYGVMVVMILAFMASPASAQSVVRESSRTHVLGSNSMTYDSGFHVKDYVAGTPVTFTMNYSCSDGCGPVVSFGLRGKGFSPSGVSGHMVGGKRLSDGVELTFVFDSLKSMGNGKTGKAQFSVNVYMNDGSGAWEAVPCEVDVHLKE